MATYMQVMATSFNHEIAKEIYQRICVHNEEPGGEQIQIIGKPGCGKTTILLETVPRMFYWDRVKGVVVPETIIWRARHLDYWNYYLAPDYEWGDERLKRSVYVFRHKGDSCSFMQEDGRAPEIQVIEYTSVPNLFSLLKPGAINVVYEPQRYNFSAKYAGFIRARGMKRFKELDSVVDGSKMWYEVFYYLLEPETRLKGFVTLVLDEADEVFLTHPIGVDWHLHVQVRNSVRDFRKAGITLLCTYHTHGDLDWMISSKMGIYGWMTGRSPPGWSQTHKYYGRGFYQLPKGEVIWEADGFGNHHFDPLKYRPRVMKIERDKPKRIGGWGPKKRRVPGALIAADNKGAGGESKTPASAGSPG